MFSSSQARVNKIQVLWQKIILAVRILSKDWLIPLKPYNKLLSQTFVHADKKHQIYLLQPYNSIDMITGWDTLSPLPVVVM